MAIFQGENLSFRIVLKDENGDTILTSEVDDISAKLYNETNNKIYVLYELTGNSDTGPLDRTIADDTDAYLFELYAADSITMPPGRYIVQITYKVTDTLFPEDNNKKITIQKGALISIMKAI